MSVSPTTSTENRQRLSSLLKKASGRGLPRLADELLKYQTGGKTHPETEREFLTWCINDPKYFLETCTQIRIEDEHGLKHDVGWRFNSIQLRYHFTIYEYIEPHCCLCVVPDRLTLKTRQYGHSTYELGDIFHNWCWYRTTNKVITYEDLTATKLKENIVDVFYESARSFFAHYLQLDPDEYLPVAKTDNKHELFCESTGAIIIFTTQGSKGSGRSATVNRIYGTEFPEWDNVADVMSGYGGSLAQRGAQVSLDGTGKGIGNAMYREYQAGKRGESVYTVFFFGRNDFAYPEGYLEKQEKRLGRLFVQEYPATDEEAFRQDDNAIFNPKHIDRAGKYNSVTGDHEAKYLCDELPRDGLATLTFVTACDPAEGQMTGSKCGITTREVESGRMACPPYNDYCTPRQAAFKVRERLEKYPGLAGVERNNHGHAVLLKLEDLELRAGRFKDEPVSKFLYRHPEPGKKLADCKLGWPETRDNKTLLEESYETALDEQAIDMPCDELRTQAREYCLNPNGKTGRPLMGTVDGGRFYDDLVIADMICQKIREQAIKVIKRHSEPPPRTGSVGSMRDDL